MSIENCRFKFRCEQTWEGLAQTPDPRVRHCSECDDSVHLCVTDSQLAEAIKRHWCVAIPDAAMTDEEADRPEAYGDIEVAQVGGIAEYWSPVGDQ